MKPVVLIDLENVKTADFGKFPENTSVYIFVGEGQNKIDFSMVEKAQQLKEKPVWVKIKGNGKNAADFHIAFFLGKLYSSDPENGFFILSKDKGFDPLVRHLNDAGAQCRRIESESVFVAEKPRRGSAVSKPARVPEKVAASVKRPHLGIRERLEKMAVSRRPKTAKAMLGFILSSDRSLTDLAAKALMQQLGTSGYITETGGKIAYLEKK